MLEATVRAHTDWGVQEISTYLAAVPGLDRWSYIVIDSHIALFSTSVLVRLSPTCLSFGTAIAILAILVVPVPLP